MNRTTVLFLFVFLFFAVSLYMVGGSRLGDSTRLSNVEYVSSKNKAFLKSKEYIKTGDFKSAEKLLIQALDEAQNNNQEAYIKYNIGLSRIQSGDYRGAVEILKSVANNENYADAHRAYALEAMGELYDRSQRSQAVADLVFNSPPYSEFLASSEGMEDAYGRLFKYALAFFPTGMASYKIAVWEFHRMSSTTVGSIEVAISSLNDEIKLFSQLGVLPQVLGERYVYRASLLSLLDYLGKSFAEKSYSKLAEDDFKKALKLVLEKDDFSLEASYHYALFLSRKYGLGRAMDVNKLLLPFYDESYRNKKFFSFFKNPVYQKDERLLKNIQTIAAVDPKFKSLMESLGWKL